MTEFEIVVVAISVLAILTRVGLDLYEKHMPEEEEVEGRIVYVMVSDLVPKCYECGTEENVVQCSTVFKRPIFVCAAHERLGVELPLVGDEHE